MSMYDLMMMSNDNIMVDDGRSKRNLCSFLFVLIKLQELLEYGVTH